MSFVGINIKRIREKQNMNQCSLAEKVGITQAALSQIERGTRNPSLQVGKEIADILGCSVETLLSEKLDLAEIGERK